MTRRSRRSLVLLILAPLLVMGRLSVAEFCNWDDPDNITRNPRLNPPSWESVGYYWTHEHMLLYMPVTFTAWNGVAAVAHLDAPDEDGISLNPWVFHAFNLLVHTANVLLVFAILLLLFKDETAATLGALLFALHPVQVETVAWVSGAKELLCGLFSLLAVWLYLLYATAWIPNANTRGRPAHCYAFALIALVLAILCKPTAMVVPVIAGAIDYLLIRRRFKPVFGALWPWLLVAAGFAIAAAVIQPASSVESVPLLARPLLAGFTVTFYLYKLLAPIHLAFDYGWRPPLLMTRWWFYAVWIIPAALALLAWLFRRRAPAFAAGAIIFVAGIAPVIGLTRFQYQFFSTVGDHYLYLSMLGVALICAWLITIPKYRKLSTIVLGVLLAACAVRSFLQTRVWRDDFALEQHILAVNPDSFMACSNLSTSWVTVAARHAKSNEPREALDVYVTAADYARRSLALAPHSRWCRDISIQFVGISRRIYPLDPTPARDARLREAIAFLEHVLAQRPGGHDLAPADRQTIHAGIGDLYALAGDFAHAAEAYEQALRLDPSNPQLLRAVQAARQRI